MRNAESYQETEFLKNGLAVKVRAIRPDDKPRLLQAFKNLEPESIYTRFFHQKRSLTDDDLERATEIDFDREVALVVTTGEGGQETIIGVGRYVAGDAAAGPLSAEVAFTVEEDYHRQGIAGRLLFHLAGIAREKGLERFVAEVLQENSGMLAVFSKSGMPMKKEFSGGAVHVTLSLKADPGPA
jgi:GNAT superfamily N-acetyltransferase